MVSAKVLAVTMEIMIRDHGIKAWQVTTEPGAAMWLKSCEIENLMDG